MAICHTCEGRGVDAANEICRACKGAGTNGVDLAIDKGRDLSIRRDVLPERALCLKRVRHGAWCQSPDGHEGDCKNDTAAPSYGPIEAKPPLWRKHAGQIQPKDPKSGANDAPKPAEPASEFIK